MREEHKTQRVLVKSAVITESAIRCELNEKRGIQQKMFQMEIVDAVAKAYEEASKERVRQIKMSVGIKAGRSEWECHSSETKALSSIAGPVAPETNTTVIVCPININYNY